jgi:predicted nucleotidyltransferase
MEESCIIYLEGAKGMRINEILEKRRMEILAIAGRYGARNIRLFGSIARGTATEASDVDLLLEMEGGRSLLDLVAIKQELEDLLGRQVHVVTVPSLSPYIRDDVLKEAVSL